MKPWPFLLAICLLAGTAVIVESLSHGEVIPNKKPFADFPLLIADRWQGRELGLDEEILQVLKVNDYMMRIYKPIPSGRGSTMRTPVSLYVGYYASQRTGATYHSPKNCLPGAGWQFVDTQIVPVRLTKDQTITINRVLIQKGLDQQLVLYWYYDRGRVIASEYWAKGYMIWDAMTKNRTDGSLVRVMVPVETTPEAAFEVGVSFLRDVWPLLQEYMPQVQNSEVRPL
ncbi:MAG: EpsI family protein [Nitrospirae bacterium]|nr:MAG: EpsI family protein [Nitrospirota bacterium]